MKSEKTAKELARWLNEVFCGDSWSELNAKGIAAFLGVELAPERPKLPGWSEEELSREGYVIMRPSGEPVRLGELTSHNLAEQYTNRAAFVEVHRRWLAAKRELESAEVWELGTSSLQALRFLRGED